MPSLVQDILDKNNTCFNDVNYFVFHQANKFMLNYLRRKCKIPKEKFHIEIGNIGNTVSSTIPIGLKQAVDSEVIKEAHKVLIVGFGVGYSYGGTIITINK